ncbi:MAG: Rpn family recombination-promoting nuclease/putative transposase [Nostoc sp. NOS(2021)]|uniref:Rpn family recombination-promoting nuclease/putative transposase n=1 Tax=Nostoc sp. NOS(2021) TaxID=2815407 RepID=UPI0025D0E7F8|nr:Rpn family recombination-promoting nuclease/putative transposase [Nostoc sp. NOS(2021)]MBN3896788.1 Rpn family recombination-promoting nuclease/putative transposase [Nostoc sp. NOS(2021)]
MKTDTIFYTLFQTLPGVLFELLEQSQSLALHYQFTSVEIKELARRIDGLFLPKPDFPEDTIYIVEVQFQRDDDIYWRIITEAFLYINQYKPQRRWQAVLLFAQRSLDPGVPFIYQTSLAQQQIRIIYLDELDDVPSSSIGLGVIKLVVAPEDKAVQQAKNLINQVQQTNEANRSNLLELVERMLIYKFVNKSQQELEAMFGLTDWRQTKFYQEVKEETKQEVKEEVREETKLETIPRLLKFGLSIEQIAEALELDVKQVRQVIEKQGEQGTGSNS